ncbi:universal stress protein [Nocardioides campestrisoli]|uniref:universal stress protein n=1 Tax=Nocardioides campestrisoli TaxID=2736757 RepID=UPI0015E76203|nr:universal stress protein [Nocardioides campestrisoli]
MESVIIAGTDGSATALTALRRAASLASALGRQLAVISAFGHASTRQIQLDGESVTIHPEAAAEAVAHEAAELIQREFPGLDVLPLAVQGRPADALVEEAERRVADLIVVGNVRTQGLGRILGSVASDVTHKASCDVYVVHTIQS